MGFDIPMSTKGAMDSSSLLSLNGGSSSSQSPAGTGGQAQQNFNQPQQSYGQAQPGYSQAQQNYVQPQQNFNQPQQNYNQTQPGYGQAQPNYSQPQQNFNQPQQNYSQPQQAQQQNFKQRPKGNGVHLKKGQKFAVAGAGGAALQTIQFCLGWDTLNNMCDLDASAFLLDGSNKIVHGDDSWFVFYGQLTSPDGSVSHSGDSLGEGAGDDEVITVKLNQVAPDVQRIAFVVTINEAFENNLNFSMVANAYVRIVDTGTNQELARFDLTDYYSNVTAMVVGELYRHNGAWKFNPVGDGVAKDLAGLCEFYGVAVAD